MSGIITGIENLRDLAKHMDVLVFLIALGAVYGVSKLTAYYAR